MSDATGQAGLMGIMLSIIAIIIVLLAGSIAYSKAFRVKNRIIDAIEKQNGYNSVAKTNIDKTLGDIGYKTIDRSKYLSYCPTNKFTGFTLETNQYPGYLYCIYKKSSGEKYYKVVSFMYFDIPFIGSHLLIPVTGETKILYSGDSWKTVE